MKLAGRVSMNDLPSIDQVELGDGATEATTQPMDRLPLLVIDQCLESSTDQLASFARATWNSGYSVASETITMPRSGFGPRPVNIIASHGRAIYAGIAKALEPNLPPASRGREEWHRFSAVGIEENGPEYVVEFDIASCYEYIEHSILHRELVVQTMDTDLADAVSYFLRGIFGRDRGLPQLLSQSDLLSDTYLQGIERVLLRAGYEVSRYADDFKVTTDSWSHANEIVEAAADVARAYGLVLSSAKTNIRKSETIRAQRQRRVTFLADYFDTARDDLTRIDVFPSLYDVEEVEVQPSDREAYETAFFRILNEWKTDASLKDLPFHSTHIPLALSYLGDADARLEDELLKQIVFDTPIRLQSALNYVLKRPELPENWKSLSSLISMERQSPWAKLWLLFACGQARIDLDNVPKEIGTWAFSQLSDRHEVVRAQAAWFLAGIGKLSDSQLRALATGCTDISRPAIAASAGATARDTGIVSALRGDSALTELAFDWGRASRT